MYIVADFQNGTSPDFFNAIAQKLSKVKVGILVNNVGTADIKYF